MVGDCNALRRGPFVVLVGPDGVGKTAIAHALTQQFLGATAYVHFRPPIRGTLPARPQDDLHPPPKTRTEGARIAGWLRLLRSVLAFSLGYWTTIRPCRKAGALIIGDRWIYGYLVQPWALRYFGPVWLARIAVCAVPQPDLIANLTAMPETIAARKSDLSLAEIQRELAAWLQLSGQRVQTFSTELEPTTVASAILDALCADGSRSRRG